MVIKTTSSIFRLSYMCYEVTTIGVPNNNQ